MYKRPIADSDEKPAAVSRLKRTLRGDRVDSSHTFSLAFLSSLFGFTLIFIAGTQLDIWAHGSAVMLGDLVARSSTVTGDRLLYIAQVVAAVLGVALTVVAIVVQLAATRYTPKILDLFLRDPVNVPTLALFVVTVLEGIWVAHIYGAGFVPRLGIHLTLGLTTASLLVLLPYFRHVFRFLEPTRVVRRIRDELLREVRSASRKHFGKERCARAQSVVLNGLDHLFDIARTSVNNSDRTLAIEVIFTFRDLLVKTRARKDELPSDWFLIFAGTTTNADFLNFPEGALRRFEDERNWLERKVFWQLNLVFQAAVGRMRGVCSTIALVTREIGDEALARGDRVLLRLVVRAFNTLFRSGMNGGDVRTLFNLLQQYRLFGESAIAAGDRELLRELFGFFRYYGRTAETMGMGFVLETATHDLAILFRAALGRFSEAGRDEDVERLLDAIVGLADDTERAALRPETRLGVRRAQAVLAAGLIAQGREDLARRIAAAMRGEAPGRLAAIRDEILSAEAEFFELTERVASFGYVAPEERPQVSTFFGWLGVTPAQA